MKKTIQKLMAVIFAFSLFATGLSGYRTVSAEEITNEMKVRKVKQTSATYHSVSLAWEAFSLAESKIELNDTEGSKEETAEPTDSYFYEVHLSEIETLPVSGSAINAEEPAEWSCKATTYDNYVTLYDLEPGKTYFVRVIAKTKALPRKTVTNYYDKVKVSTIPSQANVPDITDLSANHVSLSWNPVSSATGYHIVGYKGTDKERLSFGSTTKTNISLSNLSAATTYHFVVYAVNDNGTYTAVNESEYNALSVTTLPKAIDTLSVKNDYVGRKAQVLSWKAAEVEGYEVLVKASGTKTTYDVLTNTCDVTKFVNHAWQSAKVRGYITVNGVRKYSGYSDSVYFTKQMQVKKVTQLRHKGKLKKQAKISWQKVKGSDSYSVYVSKKPTRGYSKVCNTKKTSYVLKKYKGVSLKPDKAYYVRVLANKKHKKRTYTSFVVNKYKKFKLK